jgi:cell division protein FtsL
MPSRFVPSSDSIPHPLAASGPLSWGAGDGGIAPVTGKRPSNLHLVREHDKRRARDLSAVALVLAPLAIVLLAFAWENVEAIRRGYALRTLGDQRNILLEENRRLRSQLAALTSLAQAETKAREELGFARPDPGQIVHLVPPTAPTPSTMPR